MVEAFKSILKNINYLKILMPQVDHITFIKIGGCICFLLIVGYLLFNFTTFFTISFFQKYFNFESLSLNTNKGLYLFI